MKTAKVLIKAIRGKELSYKEARLVDDFLQEIKTGVLTLLALAVIMLLLHQEGCLSEI